MSSESVEEAGIKRESGDEITSQRIAKAALEVMFDEIRDNWSRTEFPGSPRTSLLTPMEGHARPMLRCECAGHHIWHADMPTGKPFKISDIKCPECDGAAIEGRLPVGIDVESVNDHSWSRAEIEALVKFVEAVAKYSMSLDVHGQGGVLVTLLRGEG